ncbi:MAG: T9SS type A sorting domain-containing protein [Bacteroidota bacterium]|nr:T9SS type A sorting domain-containing protein [Bacteroidota bacterium]
MKHLRTLILLFAILLSLKAAASPALSSLPSASATIYLDFDGYYVQNSLWNSGNPIDCAPAALTDAQITEIFDRVSEDFRPFNINITTDSTVFYAAPLNERVRIIVTPTSGWYTGVGGVAYTGSFTWGDDTPGFVFTNRLGPDNPKMVAECCTHESGHTLGLSHQSTYDSSCHLLSVYNMGTGSGQTGWAPIMGDSYFKNFSGWYNGPTPNGCSNTQDALTIITTQNGFGYRADDHSDNPAVNPSQVAISNQAFQDSGIITTNTDKDAFAFTLTSAGRFHLDAVPYSVGPSNDGADLDIKLQLLNSSYQTIGTYDSLDILNASIDTVLQSGQYYVMVQGSGNAYTTSYGSLGSYTISGTFTPLFVTPIKQVLLTGQTSGGQDLLKWNIISDNPVSMITVEGSRDGTQFTTLATLPGDAQQYLYTPAQGGVSFFRISALSISDQMVYSNIISLNAGNNGSDFKIPSLVYNQVTVNAAENFQYNIADMSGRILKTGSGSAGFNSIDISNSPNGIYLLQLHSSTQRLVKRIVKL